MATIRQRGGKWQVQVRRSGRPPLSKTFTIKHDAERWARGVEIGIERGQIQHAASGRTTVAEVVQRYERDILPLLRSRAATHLKPILRALGSIAAGQLSNQDLAAYRDARLKCVSAQTVKHELGLLNRALKHALQECGVAFPNGIPRVRNPKLPPGRQRRLRDGEEARLLSALDATVAHGAMVLALETGLRRGELAAMRTEHLRLTERLLDVPRTKTDRPRTIPLSTRAVQTLRTLPVRRDGLVLGLRPDSITQAFNRACRRAEINDLRFHDLRHEATSRLFEKGLGIMEVALVTGHETLSMLKRYTHLRPESLVERLG